MVQRCEHCGQTVVATDERCWHCGKKLSHGKLRLAEQTPTGTAVADNNPVIPSFTTIFLYAGLTAVALLILITTTRAIGQAPLFLLHNNNIPQAGWQPITDSQLRFTLNLPNSWRFLEMTLAPEAPALRSSPPLQALNNIFTALVADSELLFLGTEDTAVFAKGTPVFVLVAHSQRLQQLTPDELVRYAQEQLPENVTRPTVGQPDNSTDGQAGRLLFNIQQDEQTWRCLEQISPNNRGVYLIVTCTSFAQFPRHLNNFEAILGSFQPLGS
jgi:hypothetical protein